MLEMLDYDLQGGDHKKLVEAITLLRGHNLLSEDLNVRFAPWFLVSDEQPTKLRSALLTARRVLRRDPLLILPLGKQSRGMSWNIKPSVRRWLQDRGFVRVSGSGGRHRVVGLNYALYLGERRHYAKIGRVLTGTFDCCKPLYAMWFLYTDRSLRSIRDLLKRVLPQANLQQHQALLLEIPKRARGAHSGLDRDDVRWFEKHGISLN